MNTVRHAADDRIRAKMGLQVDRRETGLPVVRCGRRDGRRGGARIRARRGRKREPQRRCRRSRRPRCVDAGAVVELRASIRSDDAVGAAGASKTSSEASTAQRASSRSSDLPLRPRVRPSVARQRRASSMCRAGRARARQRAATSARPPVFENGMLRTRPSGCAAPSYERGRAVVEGFAVSRDGRRGLCSV